MSEQINLGRTVAGADGAFVLPAGEVTFLFTDVEGSTQAWERHPEAMPHAMTRHKEMIATAVSDHGGAVVKDTGDGLFAVFADARRAVAAAVEAQCRLEGAQWQDTGPLRARMGLHSGEAEPIAGDYHAPAVNRCARIMGVAHGGQILLSAATHQRVGASRGDISFLDLGPHRLRDLSTPVHLHQVLHPRLPSRFPRLRSLDALANNLPAELTSFVGRQAELQELAEMLAGTRLLTLTGPGGVGKTRLALQLAADQVDRYADGVWFVGLGGIADPALVAPEVASALQIGDQPGRGWLDGVVWYLRGRETMLVLDTCEHLLDEVAALAVTVLRHCPRVRVMTTSREQLNVPGERVWHVPSLSLTPEAGTSEAVRLFIERARDVDPTFRPGELEIGAIAQICARLDGIPLAIELAAARMRVLSAAEIADRLHDRFRLLTGGSRTALPRQRTLEATVRWSYELLDEPERALLDRLAVFAGRFSLDAVEQVCTGGGVEPEAVLDLLTKLADRSLVVHERVDGSSRYRVLETIRAYGLDRLAEHGELARLRTAHLAWLNAFARSAAPSLDGPNQEVWIERVAELLDDVRAGLAWGLESDQTAPALGCAATLYRYWYVRSVREGRQWLDRLLAAARHVPPKLLAKALFADGSLTQALGDNEAAIPTLERSLALYRELGNDRGAAWTLHGLGMAEWALRDPESVKARFEEALAIFRQVRDIVGMDFALQFLSLWEYAFGDTTRAMELAAEMLAVARWGAPPYQLAHAVEGSAMARWKGTGDIDQARELLGEALALYRELGSPLCAAHCLGNTAAWALEAGAVKTAARLQGASEALREDAGRVVPAPYENLMDESTRERIVAALGPDAYTTEVEHGRGLDLEGAIDTALAVVTREADHRERVGA